MIDFSALLKIVEDQQQAQAQFVGNVGELAFKQFAAEHLSDDYYIFTNVVLKSNNGTTQIDQVIVSKFGVFVIEIKNYSGWVWGNAQDPQWTQTLKSGKYRFQNPLRQNYKHLKALQSLLGYRDGTFKSLIAFSQQTEFKTTMPSNVVNNGDDFLDFIEAYQTVLLSDDAVISIIESIQQNRLSDEDHQAHIKKIKQQYSHADENNAPKCPRCTATMVLRTAKSGKHKDNKFLGCQHYPRCKAIININNDKENIAEEMAAELKHIENVFSNLNIFKRH